MKRFIHLLIIMIVCLPLYSMGQMMDSMAMPMGKSCSGCCCDFYQTPAGIMTDHIHPKGKLMLNYTYMNMRMQGNYMGGTKASDGMVYQNYMMAPQNMTMQMHMLMAMYGVTDRLTLMAMGSYVRYNMDMGMAPGMVMPGMTMMGGNMNDMMSATSGFGDTKVYALYNFSTHDNRRFIGGLGVNLPTGSTTATGTTMLGDNQRVSYDMQPGTGSYSLLPSFTYVDKKANWSWGGEAGADVKLNNNAEGYKYGNVYNATAWLAYRFLPFVSASIRAEGIDAGKIFGSDPAIAIPINESSDPTANTANYGGMAMSMYAGLNFHFNKPVLKNATLLLEYGMPVYQDLNGTQMAMHSNILAGLQYMF